jgi:hypothetical protein
MQLAPSHSIRTFRCECARSYQDWQAYPEYVVTFTSCRASRTPRTPGPCVRPNPHSRGGGCCSVI